MLFQLSIENANYYPLIFLGEELKTDQFAVIIIEISLQLQELQLPRTRDFVRDHPLLKNDVIPIGPNGKADMRYFQHKIRGMVLDLLLTC